MTHGAHAGGSAGLGDPESARSNCGVGVVMDLDGEAQHRTVQQGLQLLENLVHRGATGAERNTGDGAGIMVQIPDAFFRDELDIELPLQGAYGVGTIFFPQAEAPRTALKGIVEETLAGEGLDVLAWRSVPTDNTSLGKTALESEPHIEQVFVAPSEQDERDTVSDEEFERVLYVARRVLEKRVEAEEPPGHEQFYVVSLDRKTLTYKGLLRADQLRTYFPDLCDERVCSVLAMVHARFSTNTLGAWHLAHPFRTLIHNGEFNTIRGNVNWMRARETDLEHECFGDDIEKLKPIINDPAQSDTASVDNTVELLLKSGRSLPHVLRMLVPEAWRDDRNGIDDEREAFYNYHASLLEPWDGPALVAATDGERVGAVLDRNGLRPCRYDRLADNTLILSSEVGALGVDESEVVERGRLQPGQCFLADPEEGRIVPDDDIFEDLSDERDQSWVEAEQVSLSDISGDESHAEEVTDAPAKDTIGKQLRARQVMHGYTHDELDHLLEPMARDGKDPVGSMGDDTPLSVLSEYNRPLFSYFRQLFAQVSNPPLDYIREELVTSLETRLGKQRNLLTETPDHARQVVLDSPILTDDELARLGRLDVNGLRMAEVDITYDPTQTDLASAVERVRAEASAAADEHEIILLTDRNAGPDRVAVSSLLAVAGVHHHLVRSGQRNHVGLVLESGDPRTVHHVATLVGYGAGAVNPYLAYESIRDFVAGSDGADPQAAVEAYVQALEDGLLKTMAKMGISTVESYRGAQIFEAVGLASDFVEEYFEGTVNRTEGIDIDLVESDLLDRHALAWEAEPQLERVGEFEHRSTGIHHQWNPKTVGTLQQAVRNGDYDIYREFAAKINEQNEQLATFAGLLSVETDERESIPLSEVESVEDIVTRFETAAMSLGSLSPEMHETNAIAMNRLGGKANTGEGGEPVERYGTEKNSHTKQVASGRFGVTSTYLASADELQIKMAQGSKPGEGGQLPGRKVNEMIASVRYSTPGVGLISPPPQHDIYSIEDLKQLIHDLRTSNPEADISVKLVAEAGIGIIAAGVAKANADVVHVSGHSGGTGASPKTSIKNAGVPWELGLAEAHQLLCETGLRDDVRLTTDGGLKTGRDVAIAALLGAEGYVFGTASLVTAGCVMARQCHENTCPVGIATQDENLRERFPGDPDHVVNYMCFIAEELREIMAELGFRTVDEMLGRVDVLGQREDISNEKARRVDLSAVLHEPVHYEPAPDREERTRDDPRVDSLDSDLLAQLGEAIETGEAQTLEAEISNEDRAVGALLSNRISQHHGIDGLPEDTLSVGLRGTAGQSFGAFVQHGVTLELVGSANDYLGKGLSGGKLVVRTPDHASYDPEESVVVGNVSLYGATAGECYINGAVGERFAVRNSGVKGVVEAAGDHACEYMTGGAIVVLGNTGKNFAAGMSGGVAYVYDPDDTLESRANTEMVDLSTDLNARDRTLLTRLVENHLEYTDSERAETLLENWAVEREQFTRVMPTAYAEIIEEREQDDVRTELPAPATKTRDGTPGVVRSGAD